MWYILGSIDTDMDTDTDTGMDTGNDKFVKEGYMHTATIFWISYYIPIKTQQTKF